MMSVQNFKSFLFTGFLVCVVNTSARCDEINSYDNLVSALNNAQSACVGISDKLTDLKRMAGINTAVTAVVARPPSGPNAPPVISEDAFPS